ncbi:hypothetical protein SLEP1_g23504 [Rubroshorea leprosula]|uniref:Uncharacterized protein n=1 Tax=Rubroshorea leprosula TaxID=152421 RepID=A0AAV5JCS0_9ROSI|nr:hypothetical protein SLEP1_g23504 [Rubroshorea leprosula]
MIVLQKRIHEMKMIERKLRAACGLDGLGETCLYKLRFDDLREHGSVVVVVDEHSPQCHVGDDGPNCAQLANLYCHGELQRSFVIDLVSLYSIAGGEFVLFVT